jgi:PAS domain S-box-containing protein
MRKDGTSIVVSITTSPIRDANGTVTGVAGISRDITERVRMEKELRDRTQNLRNGSRSAPPT